MSEQNGAAGPVKLTALVTGASGGIGLELARLFAADGHNLVLVSRSESELHEIAQNLETQYGVQAIVIPKDLFNPDAARQLYEEVHARGIQRLDAPCASDAA